MLELKDYQQRSLNALTRYFRACVQIDDPDVAFYQTTAALYGQGVPYRRISELPGLPYVCLRLPTGGGKTLLAAHSIGVAAGELLHTDHPLVLWLTPSNTIRQQTLKALQDLQHPYRQAVEAQAGRVTVCDLSDALALQPSTLSSSTTIIVATMQAFRVGDTEGRKVYEANGALMSHFSSAPAAALQGLEQYADGAPVPCLANVLRLHRPALIVDEAHNARTSLSFETLARFSPSCILEFTATPDTRKSPSNVLYTVSAAELKSAGMIKLPIELVTEADWRETVNQAVNKRSQLEEIARQERAETGEYIRPILLLQAQPRSQERQNITVEILEKHLLEDQRIPAGQIARATGSDYQIEGLDLSSPTCPISYIITVQALREGWDCPFAYVLCSVAELHAQTAVEQILGRVLRLPKAGSKCNPELNRAYAFVTSAGFEQAATSLKDALVQNGFDRLEADELIAAQPAGVQQIDFWPWLAAPGRQETPGVYLAEAPDLSALSTELAQQITYDPSASRLTVRAGISSEQGEMLRNSFSDPSIQAVVSLAVQQARQPTDNRSSYVVPLLAVRQGSLVSQLDASYFLDRPIALARYSPFLDEAEYSGRNAAGQRGVIDIDASGRMRASYVGRLQAQLSFLSPDQSWSVMELAAWLDRSIPHPDIPQNQSVAFLTGLIEQLIAKRGFSLADLVKDKYRLKSAAQAKIAAYRKQARQQAFQQVFTDEFKALLALTADVSVVFEDDPMSYPAPQNSLRQGQHPFRKHYYPTVGDIKAQGEEYDCALYLDRHPKVSFWVRNLDNRRSSFWLPTSTDRFYPDFVCRLADGRDLVVEYKGQHLWGAPDAQEKLAIGRRWEEVGEGRRMFVMPNGPEWGAIEAKIG